MKRPRYAYACYGATLAILLAIAVLPISSWSFKNSLDILTGGWAQDEGELSNWFTPVRLTNQVDEYPNAAVPPGGTRFELQPSYPSFVRDAHADPTDPAKLAHLICLTFMAPYGAPGDVDYARWPGHKVSDARSEALWAATQGTKVDSNNGFFWLFQALLLDWSEKTNEAYASLERATTASEFDDYSFEDGESRHSAMKERFGYRGEKPRAVYLGSVFLPHFASLKKYAKVLKKRPPTRDNMQAQADLMRVADLMERKESSLIGLLVGETLPVILLVPYQPLPAQPETTATHKPIDYRAQVPLFNEKERKAGVARPIDPKEIVEHQYRIRSAANDSHFSAPIEPMTPAFSLKATAPAPALLLASILSVLLAVFVFKGKPFGVVAQRMAPYFLTAIVFWLLSEFSPCRNGMTIFDLDFFWGKAPLVGTMATWLTVGMGLMGALHLRKNLRVTMTVLGFVTASVVSVLTYPAPYLFIPPAVFVAWLLVNRMKVKLPYAVTGAFVVAALAGTALLVTVIALRGIGELRTAYLLGFGSFFGVFLLANRSSRVLQVMPVATLVLGLGYLGAVVSEIKQNEEIKASLDGWPKQADLLRAQAGIDSK